MTPEKQRAMGRRIRVARAGKGLSQTEVATTLGVTQGAVSQYELGRTEPKASVLWQMSEIFEVSAEWLLGLPEGEGKGPI